LSDKPTTTLTFEDKEYNISDLSERAQVLVGFVREVREESSVLQKRLTVLQAAQVTFSKELEEILTAPEQESLDGID
jgi:hypothetical protein